MISHWIIALNAPLDDETRKLDFDFDQLTRRLSRILIIQVGVLNLKIWDSSRN